MEIYGLGTGESWGLRFENVERDWGLEIGTVAGDRAMGTSTWE